MFLKEDESIKEVQLRGRTPQDHRNNASVSHEATNPFLDHMAATSVPDGEIANPTTFIIGRPKKTNIKIDHRTNNMKRKDFSESSEVDQSLDSSLPTTSAADSAQGQTYEKSGVQYRRRISFENQYTWKESENMKRFPSDSTSKWTINTESVGIPLKKTSFIQFIEDEEAKTASSELLHSSKLSNVSDQEITEEGTRVQSTESPRRKSIIEHIDSLILIEKSFSNRFNLSEASVSLVIKITYHLIISIKLFSCFFYCPHIEVCELVYSLSNPYTNIFIILTSVRLVTTAVTA